MRKILLILSITHFFAMALFADIYAIKDRKERFVYFSTPEQKSVESAKEKERVYYKYGIISEEMKFVTTGYIQVAFEKDVDIESFAVQNGLEIEREIRKKIYIFKNSSQYDDVQICSFLWEKEGVEYARPLFKSRKKLK